MIKSKHFNGIVKYLILQGNPYISDLDWHRAPLHISIAHLLGAVNLEITNKILQTAPKVMPRLADELLGRAILGGYARLVSDNPPIYKHIRVPNSVPSATEEDFSDVQRSGIIYFNKFTIADAKKRGLSQ